jgi:Co/Zn/Cd efflux system component
MEARNNQERKTLLIILGINAFMFIFEMILGLVAQSTGLIADSLDMLADALVYTISFYAVGKSNPLKIKAAKISGYTQILLAFMVLADVLRRFIFGSEPVSILMMGVGAIALIANAICLTLIAKHRDGGVHMRASLIFSKNDVIANLGIIVAGALVWVSGSRYPDLVIGTIITIVVFRGGLQILKETSEHKEKISCESTNQT